jgi:hypothetical protein
LVFFQNRSMAFHHDATAWIYYPVVDSACTCQVLNVQVETRCINNSP